MASGIKAQKITASGIILNNGDGVYQNVKVNPNTSYTINGLGKAESLTNATIQLNVSVMNNSNQVVGSYSTALTPSNTGGYTPIQLITGALAADAVTARVYIFLTATGSGQSGTIYVDSMDFR